MPLSPSVAPCNICIDVEMYRIAEETGNDPNISTVDLNQITKTFRYCCRCGHPFCPDHASPVDQSDCCQSCLPFEDVMEMKTPLITQDETGTHVHRGHRLVPTGVGYKTLPKAISQMTDDELTAFITEKGNQIHNIEKQRDYLRVAQSTAKLEKGEREIAATRALKRIKLPPGVLTPSNKGIKITGSKAGNGAIKGVAAPAGLDLAAFLKFASSAIAKKNSLQTSAPASSPSVAATSAPPTAPAHTAQGTAVVTPPTAGAESQAVTVKKEGGTVDGPAPPSAASLEEQAREAEIEAILGEEEFCRCIEDFTDGTAYCQNCSKKRVV